MKVFIAPPGESEKRKEQFLQETEEEHDLVRSLDFDDIVKYYGFKKEATWIKADQQK